MRRAWFCALSLALTASSCSNPAAPDDPTPTTRSVKTFFGTLDPGGTQFYSFTVTATGTTDLTLQILRPAGASVPALATPLLLSLGTPQGTGCGAPLAQVTVQPALLPQISVPTAATTYCAQLADPGNLAAAADFNIRIEHP